ncbi:MAG: DUF2306 domain-containing protein [Candidatus Acidiferrum sp.]
MTYSPVLILHICGAVTGLLSGWVALFSRKGSRLHRATGNVFFLSMLIMSASAAYLAVMKQQLINSIVGVLTFYMVTTAWVTVIRKEGETGLFEYGALLVALGDGAAGLIFGWQATNSPAGLRDGYPATAYFVFGSVALFAAALDTRMLIHGGVSGAQRITRHLWRMCFAFLITVLSFFLGKQQLLPEAILKTHLNLVPILIVAVSMIYWLIRVRFTNAYKKTKEISGTAGASIRIFRGGQMSREGSQVLRFESPEERNIRW